VYRLIGMAVPFGERSTNPTADSGFRERVESGAFDQRALDDASVTRVAVNHKRPWIEDAEVSLHNAHSGLYCVISMPNNAAARSLMRQRQQWTGMSIAFTKGDCDDQMHWPSCTRVITRVGWLSHISICVGDSRPAYSGTWISEHSPEALARVKAENHAALVRMYGANYREMREELWAPPLQSTAMEAVLRTHQPDRDHWLVLPWGNGSFCREFRP
jgi:HK97 family phage prohead protease